MDELVEPLRILLLTDTAIASSGGSERFLRNLVTLLDPTRFEVWVAQLARAPKDGSGFPVPVRAELRFYPVRAIYDRTGIRAFVSLRRLVRRVGFDVIQSQHEKSDLLCALLPRGPRRAIKVSNRRDMGFKKSDALRRAFRALNHRFDRICAPSHAILDALGRDEHVPRERTDCIPNGVDAERFVPPAAAERLEARRTLLGYDAQAVVFGCVASLSPVKRHVDLVDAFAAVVHAVPAARLVLAGEGELRGEIETRIARHGIARAVQLVGSQPDVRRLLHAVDVFVLASETEGMSNAILEAMSSGLPVIATAVGGNLDLIEPGRNGTLVPPGEIDALADAMLTYARDAGLRAERGAAARELAVAEFSLRRMGERFEALWQAVRGEARER